MTKGDCAVFYIDGKEVGGCFAWEMSMNMASNARHGWNIYRVLNSKAITKRWWLSEKVDSLLAKFYWVRDDNLVSAGEYSIRKVRLPNGEVKLNQINGKELVLEFNKEET